MQQPCSSCLARRIWGMKGTRSYGVVPKPPPKAKSTEMTVRRSPRARFGLSNPSASNERVDQRPHSDPQMTGETSRAERAELSSRASGTRGARRSRLAGFLDEDGTSTPIKPREYSPKTSYGTTTSEAFRKGHPTRNDERKPLSGNYNTSGDVRRPLYPPSRNSAAEVVKTRQSTREPLDTSAQPYYSEEPSFSRRKYHFKSLHHDTAIQAFHRPSTSSTPIIRYRDTFLNLRATPSNTLPTPPPSPFPPDLPSLATKHPGSEIINFGVVASKNAVSPFAPERGKARKRFKNAVDEVINGGKGELRSDWSYLAVLNREVYEADMNDLCGSLENGLNFIRRQQERGIGSDSRQGTRRR